MKKMEIDSMTSVAMVLKYWYNRKATDEEQMKLALKYYQNRQNNLNRGAMYYHLYNLDYQNTQIYFNLGLDFIVASKEFKDIVVLQNTDFKRIFKLMIRDFDD